MKNIIVYANKFHPIWNSRKTIFSEKQQQILDYCKNGWISMSLMARQLKIRNKNLGRYTDGLLSCGALKRRRDVLDRNYGLTHFTYQLKTVFYPVEPITFTQKQFDKRVDLMWDYDYKGIDLCYVDGWDENYKQWTTIETGFYSTETGELLFTAGSRGPLSVATPQALAEEKAIYNGLSFSSRAYDEEFMFGDCFLLVPKEE